MPQLTDLADTHRELRSLLESHLESIVVGDLAGAREHWADFTSLLRAHSLAEEELLVPRFRELGLESTGCTIELMDREHRKIKAELVAGDERVAAVGAQLEAPARLAWVRSARLLEELLAHHDQRERAGFFPALDDALDAEERDRLHAAFRDRESAGRGAAGRA